MSVRKPFLSFTCGCIIVVGLALSYRPVLAAGKDASLGEVRQFLTSYCADCHSGDEPSARLDVTALGSPMAEANFSTWVKIHDRVDGGEMPPAEATQPERDERLEAVERLRRQLHEIDEARQEEEGRVVMRRLNGVQIENTLRDLLSLPALQIYDLLPLDSTKGGFDTVSEALDVSSVHVARYLEAAQHALDEAIIHRDRPETVKRRLYFQDEGLMRPPTYPFLATEDEAIIFGRETGIFKANLKRFPAPYSGRYRIRISARGYQTDEPLPMAVVAGQGVRRSFLTDTHLLGYLDAPPGEPEVVELTARLEFEDRIRIYPPTLTKTGFPREGALEANTNYEGPGLAIQWVEVEGPLFRQWPPKSHERLFAGVPLVEEDDEHAAEGANTRKKRPAKKTNKYGLQIVPDRYLVLKSDDPEGDAERLLRSFLPQAFRRPVDDSEVELYVDLVREWLAQGATFEEAMRVGYTAILTSPEFLYFQEQPGPLDDYALASRLSYFLWNSMPDEELFELAAAGRLHDPEVLTGQVERLLEDERSERFIADFLGQWLDLYNIDLTSPDPELYPEFDELLKHSMVREAELFFRETLDRDLSVRNIVESDFAMLNGRLAEHYGVGDVAGVEFERVSLPEGHVRGGLLTQAGVMKVTANGTTTSPVLRGVWVLDRILGTPPDPPPANVPAIEPDIRGAVTIREQLAKHREMEQCAVCHRKIDPLGYGLENFDVIGGWREHYRALSDSPVRGAKSYKDGSPVESSDTLADGRTFGSVQEFKDLLADEEALARCLTAKLLTYSTGAVPGFADRETIDAIVQRAAERGYGVRTLIREVVLSEAFRTK